MTWTLLNFQCFTKNLPFFLLVTPSTPLTELLHHWLSCTSCKDLNIFNLCVSFALANSRLKLWANICFYACMCSPDWQMEWAKGERNIPRSSVGCCFPEIVYTSHLLLSHWNCCSAPHKKFCWDIQTLNPHGACWMFYTRSIRNFDYLFELVWVRIRMLSLLIKSLLPVLNYLQISVPIQIFFFRFLYHRVNVTEERNLGNTLYLMVGFTIVGNLLNGGRGWAAEEKRMVAWQVAEWRIVY